MPLLKIDFMSRVLALAEPVPLTVAILMVKSLTRLGGGWVIGLLSGVLGTPFRAGRRCAHAQAILGFCASMATASLCACGQWSEDFCMSHAAVGQRSAHRPQCTHRSSSFTMTRPVCGRPADTYSSWVRFFAGALRRERRSASSPLWVMVRQSTGQISMQASHSMHSFAVNTVCTSQLR